MVKNISRFYVFLDGLPFLNMLVIDTIKNQYIINAVLRCRVNGFIVVNQVFGQLSWIFSGGAHFEMHSACNIHILFWDSI